MSMTFAELEANLPQQGTKYTADESNETLNGIIDTLIGDLTTAEAEPLDVTALEDLLNNLKVIAFDELENPLEVCVGDLILTELQVHNRFGILFPGIVSAFIGGIRNIFGHQGSPHLPINP